jgi:predicted metalloprotease with PDZ domain
MRTRFLSALFAGMLLISCGSTKTIVNDLATAVPIETLIDLSKVENDKVPVTINPGRFNTDNVIYRLPKVVQGTYAISNFGRYIDDFKAYDYKGNELSVVKTDVNTWMVANGKQLDKITYWVNDTFDEEKEGGIGKEEPFSPSGTNIEPDNYVLNLHGFIGYFDSLKDNQYKVNVTAPADFVRSSALHEIGSSTSADGKTITTNYIAPRYFDVTDNPMMYGNLSVEEFMVGDIKIVLSVYSPNKVHSAQSLKPAMLKMMEAQKRFLGDIDSTPRYDIFLYLSDGSETAPKGFGALEHHRSTVVVMPENYPAESLDQGMIDVVSHEFFHIVTPLSVHSEDVHYFDYNNPTFSKHLWMYEGVTEYFATLFQVNQDLFTEDKFYSEIYDKISGSLKLDDTMSFTVMSENVLDKPYSDQYLNVYQKGALIGMCIDILMREESNGQRGILSLMKELSKKYGVDKPFEDDKLIDEITVMTYPSVGQFLKTHVEGTTPINYTEFFEKVGLEIVEDDKVETNFVLNGGDLIIAGNPQYGTIFFTDAVKDNSFWNDLGVKPGDIIKTIDGTDLTMQNANTILQQVFMWKVGQEVNVKLVRAGEPVEINATTVQSYTKGEVLKSKTNVTKEQLDLRQIWLKG